MLLSGVLFAVFLAGCWLYCLTEAALTPSGEFPGVPKRAWVAFIAVTFIVGAIAWWVARQFYRARRWPQWPPPATAFEDGPSPRSARGDGSLLWYPDDPAAAAADPWTAAVERHPATRSRRARRDWTGPKGPDDDPEFIRQLERRIRGE